MTPFSLILPCYNESASLHALVERVKGCMKRRELPPEAFRLILVNNGSTDDSAGILEKIESENGFIRVVTVPVNRGYGYGVLQGLKAAETGIIGWTHADEQCDPEDAFKAWEMADASRGEGMLVKGTRHGRALGDWLFSRCFEAVATGVLWRWMHEINAQPKVFHRELLDSFREPPDGFAFDLYVLLKARDRGYGFREIDVEFPPRRHGESKWAATFQSKMRTIKGMLRFIVDYRLKPL